MIIKSFCAHRGLSALVPENTLPAFAAAYALGADEIEFDVRLTCDGRMVVSHDSKLERISDGRGRVADFTLAELRELNVGIKQGWQVGLCTPEEVFELPSGGNQYSPKGHGEVFLLVRSPKSTMPRKAFCRVSDRA